MNKSILKAAERYRKKRQAFYDCDAGEIDIRYRRAANEMASAGMELADLVLRHFDAEKRRAPRDGEG